MEVLAMSKQDFLLEIGLEEMPARMVQGAIVQLRDKVAAWLGDKNLAYQEIKTYSTPRRLALKVTELVDRQADVKEEAKGPAKRIAQDDQGNWSKAAEGFVKGQGLSVEDIYFKEFKGEEYAYVTKDIKGRETKDLLLELSELIKGLSFPKNMRWGSLELRFVRPIRWLVAIYGSEHLAMSIANVHSDCYTYGHRFLGDKIELKSAQEYEQALLGQYVIASADERREAIIKQLQSLQKEHGWSIHISEDLLDEVTYLVEYPTAIFGSFDQDFLNLPEDVLVTSMREHQRYFPVFSPSGKLLPYFVTIRNGGVDPNGIVVKGNEKVLRARLADANFFFEEDQKLQVDHAISQLENVVFHEELGTIGDKIRRLKEITKQLVQHIQLSNTDLKNLERATEICKFDLVTQMVNEFPELQGKMGRVYAQLSGENSEVALAIEEQYYPRSAQDQLPTSAVGSLLSVVDRLDTIIGCFSIGIIPTGSQDPYGLRRLAAGIVSIFEAQKWNVSLQEAFLIGVNLFSQRQLMKQAPEAVISELHQFFNLRLKHRLQEGKVRYDIIDALLNGNQYSQPLHHTFAKADVLDDFVKQDKAKETLESFTRVLNLAQKLEQHQNIHTELFESDAEHSLYEAYQQARAQFLVQKEQQNWQEALQALTGLTAAIVTFFDQVLVMAEDDNVRMNRLSLLHHIGSLLLNFADFKQIVTS